MISEWSHLFCFIPLRSVSFCSVLFCSALFCHARMYYYLAIIVMWTSTGWFSKKWNFWKVTKIVYVTGVWLFFTFLCQRPNIADRSWLFCFFKRETTILLHENPYFEQEYILQFHMNVEILNYEAVLDVNYQFKLSCVWQLKNSIQ